MGLTGELKGISSADKNQLEKILKKRSRSPDVIDIEIARRISLLSQKLRRSIAVLIGRDGAFEYVVIGTKQRVYLPSLGRYRLDDSRLRHLRLVVFVPESALEWIEIPGSRVLKKKSLAPKVAPDFVTDLEKLRLDLVCIIAVEEDGSPSSFSIAYLDVLEISKEGRETGVSYRYEKSLLQCEFDFPSFIEELEDKHSTIRSSTNLVKSDYAILVGVYTGSDEDAAYSILELKELCRTAGVEIAQTFIQKKSRIDPKTVLGHGKIEELVLLALDLGAELLIFDCELTPGQLRAVTKITELKILDRSMLILDIFAQRAKSAEGRLQVELAQLKYSLPRLSDRDSGLSRLTGGIGGRGPGETKLEISRRRVRDRISFLDGKIDNISKQRGLRREKRKLRGVPVISIVGYTNAGKSTLLNTITKGKVFVENKLFATLDPSSRRMRFPNEKEVLFIDTVGFIRNLPDELVGAFRATLEEVGEADLLLHVVDVSQSEVRRHIEVVEETLDELGFSDKQKLLVLNKADLLSTPELNTLVNSLGGIAISALTRLGVSDLLSEIVNALNDTFEGGDPGGFLEFPGGEVFIDKS
jgi:GTPase